MFGNCSPSATVSTRRCPPSPTAGRSEISSSRTGSCWLRSPASATGSCGSRRAASGPGWSPRRWSPPSGSPTATSAPSSEFLRIHPDEHPVSIQLFGHDPAVMREAAAMAADAGADVIDLNMGCPVRKVCKTGAGAALLEDPSKAVAWPTAAGEGSGLPDYRQVPAGQGAGRSRRRRIGEAAGRRKRASPESPSIRATRRSSIRARPTTLLARELAEQLPVPVILSGGLADEDKTLAAFEQSNAAAVMLARGSPGQPLALRAPAWPLQRRAERTGGGGGAENRVIEARRGPPRHRSRRPLFAEVLPLVRRHARAHQTRARGARHGPHDGPRPGRDRGPDGAKSCLAA